MPDMILRVLSSASTVGFIVVGHQSMPCALGRSGIRVLKREGDGATPRGRWRLRCAFYRGDRQRRPIAAMPLRPLRPADGWCDAVADRNYNRLVRHPYPASAERMWRDDHLYDIVVVIAYNEWPRAQGKGSAIFVHLARPGFAPTEGCIALREGDLRKLLAALPRRACVVVP